MEKRRIPCPWGFNLSHPYRSIVTVSTELSRILTVSCRPIILWVFASCSFVLLFHLEDGGNTFLRNVSEFPQTTERRSQETVVFKQCCYAFRTHIRLYLNSAVMPSVLIYTVVFIQCCYAFRTHIYGCLYTVLLCLAYSYIRLSLYGAVMPSVLIYTVVFIRCCYAFRTHILAILIFPLWIHNIQSL
jgi:hypothetical protein